MPPPIAVEANSKLDPPFTPPKITVCSETPALPYACATLRLNLIQLSLLFDESILAQWGWQVKCAHRRSGRFK
jgi:hypothetical protein